MIKLSRMAVKAWMLFDTRHCQLGEGPHYDDRTGRVSWVDILGSQILWRAFDRPDSGEILAPGHVGAVVPRKLGGLVACLPWGLAAVSDAGEFTELARYSHVDKRLRSNDAKADPAGRLWVGTMAYAETAGCGALYRLDPGSATPIPLLTKVTVSNGLGWSPDGTTMYHIDSPTRRVDAFEFDMATGALGERRTFAELEVGYPDGLCVDADGGIWVALWQGGQVRRYTAAGQLDRILELPVPKVTSCTFAGPHLDTLIVTTVGQTYAFEVGDVTGLPVARFAG